MDEVEQELFEVRSELQRVNGTIRLRESQLGEQERSLNEAEVLVRFSELIMIDRRSGEERVGVVGGVRSRAVEDKPNKKDFIGICSSVPMVVTECLKCDFMDMNQSEVMIIVIINNKCTRDLYIYLYIVSTTLFFGALVQT